MLSIYPFQKGIGLQESKPEVTKVASPVKMTENLLRASSHHKNDLP